MEWVREFVYILKRIIFGYFIVSEVIIILLINVGIFY